MAITITNEANYIALELSDIKTINILKGQITSIEANDNGETNENIVIHLSNGMKYTLKYVDVTSPSTDDAIELATTIAGYDIIVTP